MVTIVGIPLALIAIALYGICLYVAKFFVALWFGQWLAREFKFEISWLMAGLLGVVLYWALSLIPLIGFVVTVFSLLAGLGALALSRGRSVAVE
jgi:hypothetical protein